MAEGGLRDATGNVWLLEMHPSGDYLLSVDFGGRAHVRSVPSLEPIASVPTRSDVSAIAISPDGSLLATLDSGSTLTLFSFPALKVIWEIPTDHTWREAVAFSPDGRTIITAGDSTVRTWDGDRGAPGHAWQADDQCVRSLGLRADGRILATASPRGAIVLWQFPEGNRVRSWTAHTTGLNRILFDSTGETLVSAGKDRKIAVWHAATGNLRTTYASAEGGKIAHRSAINDLAISRDGRYLASSSDDKTVRLWSFPDGHLLSTFAGHTSYTKPVCFHPAGLFLASGSHDQTIRLWPIRPA